MIYLYLPIGHESFLYLFWRPISLVCFELVLSEAKIKVIIINFIMSNVTRLTHIYYNWQQIVTCYYQNGHEDVHENDSLSHY